VAGAFPFLSYPTDERHFLAIVRYDERNPVDAGLVEREEDWEWSSARYHLGISTTDRLVRERSLFGLVNDWREYLTDADAHDNTNYELHLRTGRPLGPADFLDQLEQLIGTSLRRKKGGWRKGKKRK
jgi:putative transposase